MKKVVLTLLAAFMAVSAAFASGRLTIGLSGPGWHLWRDADAQWADDKLYLPSEATDLTKLPVNAPTGGWSVLEGEGPDGTLNVSVPGNDMEYLEPAANQREPRPDHVKGVCWWWRTITVPASEAGKKFMLDFEGFRQRAEVYVDGELVAYDIVAETPYAADITKAIKPGKTQTLAVRITNHGGNTSWGDFTLERWGNTSQMMPPSHGFGGITGRVNLHCIDPKAEIADVWVKNKPSQNYNTVDAVVTLGDYSDVKTVRASITDYDNADNVHLTKNVPVADVRDGQLTLTDLTFDGAKLWDLEHPNLYRLRVELLDGAGTVLDDSSRHFGFRWFEGKGFGDNANFYLNGKRVVLRSAISWGYWSKGGIYSTKEQTIAQVNAAKSLGLNCLNFHRNIGGPLMLETADEMGLLYFEEPGAYHSGVDDFNRGILVEKTARMIKRDRSHPSLVIYNLINEFFGDLLHNQPLINKRLNDMREFHKIDETRFLLLCSGNTPGVGNQTGEELHKTHMRPYDETLYQVGWQDVHQAGAPETWKEGMYRGPDNLQGVKDYNPKDDYVTKEIWVRGEEGALSTPPRIEKIHNTIQQTGELGWDGLYWENQYSRYQRFFKEQNLYKYFGSIDKLTELMGNVSMDHQARRITNFRMRNCGDMYAINGWESEPYDNHSGVVDIYRNTKGDAKIMKEANAPLLVAVKTRNQIVKSPATAIVDFYIINEQVLPAGTYTLKAKMVGPTGAVVQTMADKSVTVSGGDVYGELLEQGVEFKIPEGGEGTYQVQAELTGGSETAKGHDEILAVKYTAADFKGAGAYYGSGSSVPQFYKTLTGNTLPQFTTDMGQLDWIIIDRSQFAEAATIGAADFSELKRTWYSDADFTNVIRTEDVDVIDFYCNNGAQPAADVLANAPYSIRYEGKITVPVDGKFEFAVNTLRGQEIYLRDAAGKELWHEQWLGNTNANTYTKELNLEKGQQLSVELKYKHNDGTKDGKVQLAWSRPDMVAVNADDILDRAKNDGTTVIIIANAEKWLGKVAEVTDARYDGSYTIGKDWVGGIHFNIDHPLMKGLPVNIGFGWQYQAVVDDGNNRHGYYMQGANLVVGSTRTYSFHLGTTVGEIDYGKGHIVFSDLKIADNLLSKEGPAEVAKKLLINYTNYSPADYFEGVTPESGRRPFRDNVVPGIVEAEDFDYGGEGVAYHYKNGESQRQEAMDKNRNDGKGRDYVYRREWVRINETPGSIQSLSGGDWFEYTIDVAEDGDYQLETVLSTGGAGSFRLYVDGEAMLGKQEFTAPDVDNKWGTYFTVVSKALSLKKGKHIFRFGDINTLNPDKFIFTRIGDYGTIEVFDNKVPGKVEAENFVTGDYEFHFGDAGNYKEYRKDKGVAISKDGDVNGKHQIYVGNMSDGDRLAYEFECTEAGDYDVRACLATIGNTKLVVTIDGVSYGTDAEPILINREDLEDVAYFGGEINDWHGFGLVTIIPELHLAKGKHRMDIVFRVANCNFESIVIEGEPENFNLSVPGKIEAENYDEGYGKYYWKDGKINGSYKQYRRDRNVAVSRSVNGVNGASGPGYAEGDEIIHLGNSSPGNYVTYTFECKTAGDYTFSTCVATMGQHKYYITVDGVDYGSEANPFMVNTGLNEWQKYQEFTAPNVTIPLTKGTHKLVYHLVHASCNMDYVRLTTDAASGVDDIVIDAEDEGLWYTVDGIAHDQPVRGAVNIHNGRRIYVK